MFSSHSKEREGGWAYEKPVVLSLELELVTNSKLNNVVVAIGTICNLSYSDVVASIKYKVLIFVRGTNRDR